MKLLTSLLLDTFIAFAGPCTSTSYQKKQPIASIRVHPSSKALTKHDLAMMHKRNMRFSRITRRPEYQKGKPR